MQHDTRDKFYRVLFIVLSHDKKYSETWQSIYRQVAVDSGYKLVKGDKCTGTHRSQHTRYNSNVNWDGVHGGKVPSEYYHMERRLGTCYEAAPKPIRKVNGCSISNDTYWERADDLVFHIFGIVVV